MRLRYMCIAKHDISTSLLMNVHTSDVLGTDSMSIAAGIGKSASKTSL